jgi:hypothetical protein
VKSDTNPFQITNKNSFRKKVAADWLWKEQISVAFRVIYSANLNIADT